MSKIEIIQTSPTTAKIFIDGQDISKSVRSYTITHEASSMAKLELIMGSPITEVKVDEICEVKVRYESEGGD